MSRRVSSRGSLSSPTNRKSGNVEELVSPTVTRNRASVEGLKNQKSPTENKTKPPPAPISPTGEPNSGAQAINSTATSNPRSTAPHGEEVPEIPALTPPMTPKSIESRSPVTAATELPGEPSRIVLPPPRTAAADRDIAAVGQLLSSMKETINALGTTFDTLGEQTIRVAQLGPAIDATHQVAQVCKDLEEQHARQEKRMEETKKQFLDQVKTQLHARLKEKASAIVKEIIQREIADRVRRELQAQIPRNLRDEVTEYKRQILEVKISLHNSEARRHNALIRSNSIEEPLRPLLRPLPPILSQTPTMTRTNSMASDFTIPASAKTIPIQDTSKAPSLRINAQLGPKRNTPLPPVPVSATELALPTPSPLFPRNLASLIRLGVEDARTLIHDYGLVRYKTTGPVTAASEKSISESLLFSPNTPRSPTRSPRDSKTTEATLDDFEEVEESREEALNRFLTYIGVGFQLVPMTPPDGKAPLPTSPLMTRAVYSQ